MFIISNMETLFEQEVTNVEGQQIRLSVFKRDARSQMEIKDNEPIRYENVLRREIYHNNQWNIFQEEIMEYMIVEVNPN